MNTELVLEVCLAVRDERLTVAQEGFNKILELKADAAFLTAAGDCLQAAYRRQQLPLAAGWLAQAQPRLLACMARAELASDAAMLLHRLAFMACDRKITELLPVLELLVLRFMRSHAGACLDAFWSEWLSLAARMARRKWRRETSFLLRLFLRSLLKAAPKEIFSRLLMLQLHFVVYARWDGFSHACEAYAELMWFYLLLVRRSGKKRWQDQQQVYLLLALRSLRDVVAQAARSLMQEDMDIFRLWYQFFWQLAGENSGRKQQLLQLLQLAICYWQATRPKTSKKQARYLEDLLQPSLINKHYAALLQKIC